MREQKALSDQLDILVTREREGKTKAQLDDNSISIVDPPLRPTSGESLKFPAMILAVMFAGATALAFGLLRGLVSYAWADLSAQDYGVDIDGASEPAPDYSQGGGEDFKGGPDIGTPDEKSGFAGKFSGKNPFA